MHVCKLCTLPIDWYLSFCVEEFMFFFKHPQTSKRIVGFVLVLLYYHIKVPSTAPNLWWGLRVLFYFQWKLFCFKGDINNMHFVFHYLEIKKTKKRAAMQPYFWSLTTLHKSLICFYILILRNTTNESYRNMSASQAWKLNYPKETIQ